MPTAFSSASPAPPARHGPWRCLARWLGGALLLAGSLPVLAQAAGAVETATQPDRVFLVGPGDVISVQVWKQPALSLQLPVLPDGSLRYPLAGELRVQGRTLGEIEQMLTERIGQTLREVVVSVAVSEVHSHRIYLLGEVLRPGEYQLRGPISLVQSLALASGLTPFARKDSIVILRSQVGVPTRLSFDLDAYLRNPDAVDPQLLPGDTIVVR